MKTAITDFTTVQEEQFLNAYRTFASSHNKEIDRFVNKLHGSIALISTGMLVFTIVAMLNTFSTIPLFLSVFLILMGVGMLIVGHKLKPADFDWGTMEGELAESKVKIIQEHFGFTFCHDTPSIEELLKPHKYLVQTGEDEYLEAVIAFTDTHMIYTPIANTTPINL